MHKKLTDSNLSNFQNSTVITNYYIRNGKVVERVEAVNKLALAFRGATNSVLRRYTTDFIIINVSFCLKIGFLKDLKF